MPLSPGARLGPYEVTAQIGAGGMGEVYRARDTKLNRDVALKILPSEFTGDPDRLARFTREAQTLAALNHPHIGAIYGLEESDGIRALVLELVEGPTLADRIAQGPVPLDEALHIARQIADALEAAHEHGIIHRDLKPANIKLRPDGTVKVLDFGLAKAMEPVTSLSPGLSQSPTITTPAMTQAGIILGSAAYMSPEQARGRAVNKRADVWAFGAVLYELVTGRRAFDGEDVAETLARVLQSEPRWDDVPATIQRLLKRCLDKDPRTRLRDIGDVWDLLESAPSGPVRTTRQIPWFWVSATAVMTTVAAVTLWVPWRQHPSPPQMVRFQIHPPEGTTFAQDVDDAPVVSPDGTKVAFLAAGQDGRARIWLQSFDSLEARRLEGTEEARYLFWSPDSRWIAFLSGGSEVDEGLEKMLVSGGPPQRLCACGYILKAAWSPSGVIVFGGAQGLMRVSADGGPVTPLTTLDSAVGEVVHVGPSFLPDGRHFLYARYGRDGSGTYVGSIDAKPSGQSHEKIFDDSAKYASGTVLFRRSGTLMSQAFDFTQLRVNGEATEVVRTSQLPSISQRGVLVWGGIQPPKQLTWFNREGTAVGSVGEPGPALWNPRVSPTDGRVAYTRADNGPGDIWLYEPERGAHRLTYGNDYEYPIWSPDGRHLAFRALVAGGVDLAQRAANGVGGEEVLRKIEDVNGRLWDWSADHQFLVFGVRDTKTQQDIWLLPLSGEKKPFPYVQNNANDIEARLAPNGKWLAYVSDPLGHFEVYVDTFAGEVSNASSRGTWQVSTTGGTRPVWSHDGKELFFISADRKMMVVDVTDAGGARFEFSAPRPLFDTQISGDPGDAFDVARDGRFLMPVPVGRGTAEPITVIMNWQSGVQ